MSVLDIEAVKLYLNVDDPTQTAEIQGFIDQAESSLGQRVGPLEPTTITERIDPPWGNPLVVSTLPAISLTSVTPITGTDFDVTTLDLDPDTGIVRLKGTSDRFWSWWRSSFIGPYVVVYQAGWVIPPADLLLGAMELVRHLWATQQRLVDQTRGASRPSDLVAGGAFAYPFRVLELINPYVQQAI